MWYPVFGSIANDWDVPELTLTAPEGEIAPLALAVAVIVKVSIANVAAMVWVAVTVLNV